ncbi:MAG: calcineurin-like phosphoesterase family protein [Candidatus Hydrogenedentota bacterium]
MKPFIQLTLATVFTCTVAASAWSASVAKGIVFHDKNGNGESNGGEDRLAGVAVSNGVDVVQTDLKGRYEIPVTEDTIVFVVKPSGWRTPQSDTGISRFYYNHKPAGSPRLEAKYPTIEPTGKLPRHIDFPLYPQKEPDTFKMIAFGDTQPRNQQEVDYIAHDVVQELVGFEAAFGITLGDVVFNNLSLYKPLEQLLATIGVPWYNVHGNHDLNLKSPDDANSDETWEYYYGPSYYSFDYGQVHFVNLDDIAWNGEGYHGELGANQLAFLKNDLALVPKDKLVVLMMHIPLTSIDDKEAVYDILDGHPNNFSISAHWHRQAHYFVDEEGGWKGEGEHHHLVHATVCGSWWSGVVDENGIPHATMADGAPNGYSIVTFSGSDYSIRFKAARRSADHQMNIYAPEVIQSADASNTQIVANVFAGSERSTVEMRLGESGDWTKMVLTPMADPYYAKMKALEPLMPKEAGRTLPNTANSTHIWTANLSGTPPPGLHLIHVRTTDMFGQTYTDQRSIRVE